MALRVLLGDESGTIKKVFQLALQDYAVEVRPVNVGLDVAQVAESFKPDIIFADVLLQKKNGYDVSRDMKNDSELSSIPIVLMWSGFMELDEDKFQASGADAQLEKPFDVNTLRKLVQDLVPKTKTQKLSQYLSFPEMPEFVEEKDSEDSAAQTAEDPVGAKDDRSKASSPPPVPQPSDDHEIWSMDQFDEIPNPAMESTSFNDEDFEIRTTSKPPIPSEQHGGGLEAVSLDLDEEESGPWQQRDLTSFKLSPEETASAVDSSDEVPLEFDPSEEISDADESFDDEITQVDGPTPEEVMADKNGEDLALEVEVPSGRSAQHPGAESLSQERLEEIAREEARRLIEKAVWQVVPDLARKVIEEELAKLLAEKEKLT